ncbi:MAG: cadherin-like domain-containing protein [Actinomycetota bacterium]|nr:cadherin-like domain-containing protein [Actinomycetota bacterium]
MEITAKADVTGVEVTANGSVVVSDINSGLYVLALHNTVTCLNITARASGGSATTVQLSCTDAAANPINYSIVTGPAHGKLGSLSAAGQVSYTPTAGYSGPDSFTYRAAASDGTSNTATVTITVASASAPVVSNYGITNKVFAVGRGSTKIFGTAAKATKHKRGTTFRYTLSEPATVKIAIAQLVPGRVKGTGKSARCVTPTRSLRHARRCTQTPLRGTLTRTSHAGANLIAFSGRVGSKALKPGSYEATLTATSSVKLRSKAHTIFFRIVRR